jgi:membrane-associated protease RseP (regulator of RpoE activity)
MVFQMDFQIISAIVFIVILSIILYIKKDKIELQKIFWPILYFALLRTKFGLKFMEKTAKKHPVFWKTFSVLGIITGFLGMILIVISLFDSLINLFLTPNAPAGVAPVLPVPIKGAIYVPFFYWIICIFIIAIVHEFAHGIISNLHGIKVKSSGFAVMGLLLPIVPAAFVEPDEKKLDRKSLWKQLGVFAAGPFANIVLGLIALLVLSTIFPPIVNSATENTGIYISNVLNETPAYYSNLSVGEVILSVDDVDTLDMSVFRDVLANKTQGDNVVIVTNASVYNVTLGTNPDNSDSAFLGITPSQDSIIKKEFTDKYGEYSPIIINSLSTFFFWLFLLNIGVGLFNLVPLGPIDGGRMLRIILLKIFKNDSEKAEKIWKYVALFFLSIILYMIFIHPIVKNLLF